MADSITPSSVAKPGMIARLKIGATPTAQTVTSGPSRAENNLADLINLSADAKDSLTGGRKLDAYLRTFSSALKLFTGFRFSSYRPVASTVEVEFVEAKNPYKIDKKI